MALARLSPNQGLLALFLAGLMWGTTGLGAKMVYLAAPVHPSRVGFVRLVVAGLLLGLVCRVLLGRSWLRVGGWEALRLLGLGLALGLYQVFYFTAVDLIGVTVPTLVTLCSAPVMVTLYSTLAGRDRPSPRVLVALLLAVAGTIALVGLPSLAVGRAELLQGVALALGSAASFAAVTLLGRSLATTTPPLKFVTLSFGLAALVLAPLALSAGPWSSYPPAAWGWLLYLGLIPTTLGYFLYFLGMSRVKATAASILAMLEPLTATVLAWLLFGERLGLVGLVGAGLLGGSTWLLCRRAET
jgi:DME family drug/metabolite transporter